ncbi:MAG TPA: DUF2844 domain-containing protein [Steroidobacteraceae bacterium]|nr:DUF2844 domain-containing protein [Steroidobacteraceae bacterium]
MKSIRSLICAILLGACGCAPALAALGGDAASVESDRASLKGALRVTERVDYAVHEIQTAAGITVREYAAPDGKVFAVTWRGPGRPDLGQLLGKYAEQLAQGPRAPHYNHHHLNIQTPEVVVQSTGRTRLFFGRAWAPALLPGNFSLNDIN